MNQVISDVLKNSSCISFRAVSAGRQRAGVKDPKIKKLKSTTFSASGLRAGGLPTFRKRLQDLRSSAAASWGTGFASFWVTPKGNNRGVPAFAGASRRARHSVAPSGVEATWSAKAGRSDRTGRTAAVHRGGSERSRTARAPGCHGRSRRMERIGRQVSLPGVQTTPRSSSALFHSRPAGAQARLSVVFKRVEGARLPRRLGWLAGGFAKEASASFRTAGF